jgi:hypothetical protein
VSVLVIRHADAPWASAEAMPAVVIAANAVLISSFFMVSSLGIPLTEASTPAVRRLAFALALTARNDIPIILSIN